MLRLIGLAISIGLADSMNPSTIAPGLYLAMGQQHARSSLIQFTFAVFAVNLVGGAAIALGPGEAVLALVPKPGATARYIVETVAGVVMLIAAVVLWRRRRSLARRELPTPKSEGRVGHPARHDDRRGRASHRVPVFRRDRRGRGLRARVRSGN